MIWWIVGILLVILIAMIVFAILKYVRVLGAKKEFKNEQYFGIVALLEKKGFYKPKICMINPHLTIAVNKNLTRLIIIRDFNPYLKIDYEIEDVSIQLLKKLTLTKSTIQLDYIKNGENRFLIIDKYNNEIKKFIYDIYKQKCLIKIQEKNPSVKFDFYEGSNFECDYFWAYSVQNSLFCYLELNSKKDVQKINLRYENITLDIKYNYFEAPIYGINQQLFAYDDAFFADIFQNLLSLIKQKTIKILEDKIYYDNYSNVIYLTNGINSLQSVLLNKVEEVYYSKNRIYFTLKGEDKIINFITTDDVINEFSEFVIGTNLRTIATNFDYKTDKLINTTNSTKLIIDYSRMRIVYCANIDTLSRFSYIVLSFDNVKDALFEGRKLQPFVRIVTKNNEAIDITCKKSEVAQYAVALIKKIVDERN